MINDPFQMQRELRYGAPVCDQILTGRYFTIGYSWYFRQAKWALEIVNRQRRLISELIKEQPKDLPKDERLDNFRADLRIPKRFRAGLGEFKGSGYDRGHLVASANQNSANIMNSETFLLSNMSPQRPNFNRKKWAELEDAVRQLDRRDDIFETYVLTCPVFYFDQPVKTIRRAEDVYGIDVPVPHAFIKSVLAENNKGSLDLWTFEMKNEELTGDLGSYLVKTYDAEQLVGGRFWDRVSGGDLDPQKRNPRKMWEYSKKAPKKTDGKAKTGGQPAPAPAPGTTPIG
jgi:endonuclease G